MKLGMKFGLVFATLVAILVPPLSARAEVIARDVSCKHEMINVVVRGPEGGDPIVRKVRAFVCRNAQNTFTILSPKRDAQGVCGILARSTDQEVCANLQRRTLITK